MRIVFLGNHNVGLEVISEIKQTGGLVGILAHPEDPEDGIVYKSVYDYAVQNNIPVIRAKPKDEQFESFIRRCAPDLLWVTDYRYIISKSIVGIAANGAINLHPSLLPKYRGRASINWAIINQETELGLTAHFIDAGVDSGDIIEQIRFEIDSDTYIGEALERYYPLYREITRKVLERLANGTVSRKKQQRIDDYPVYPKRTAEDGKIDWNKPAVEIRSLIRAVSKPYPGAFGYVTEKKLTIWRANVVKDDSSEAKEGTIIRIVGDTIYVKCKDGLLEITDYTIDPFTILEPGLVITSSK